LYIADLYKTRTVLAAFPGLLIIAAASIIIAGCKPEEPEKPEELAEAKQLQLKAEWEHDSTFQFGPKPGTTDLLLIGERAFYFHFKELKPEEDQPFGELFLTVRDIETGEEQFSEKIHDDFDIGHATGPSLQIYEEMLIVEHGGFRGESPYGIIAYGLDKLEELYRRQFEGDGSIYKEGGHFYRTTDSDEDFHPEKYSLETGELTWQAENSVPPMHFPSFSRDFIVYEVENEVTVIDRETGETKIVIDEETAAEFARVYNVLEKNGQILFISVVERDLKIFDQTGEKLWHKEGIAPYNPGILKGQLMGTEEGQQNLLVYDPETGEKRESYEGQIIGEGNRHAYLYNEAANTIKQIDLATGMRAWSFDAGNNRELENERLPEVINTSTENVTIMLGGDRFLSLGKAAGEIISFHRLPEEAPEPEDLPDGSILLVTLENVVISDLDSKFKVYGEKED